jgi:hypothetical protein
MAARRASSPSAAPPPEPPAEPERAPSSASNHTPPQPRYAALPDNGGLVTCFVTVGVRTSDGPGPGVKHVPPAAAALLADRVAVSGDQPPRNWSG